MERLKPYDFPEWDSNGDPLTNWDDIDDIPVFDDMEDMDDDYE